MAPKWALTPRESIARRWGQTLQPVLPSSAAALVAPPPPVYQPPERQQIARTKPTDGTAWLDPRVVQFDADTIRGWQPQPPGVPCFRATACGTAREWMILKEHCSVYWGSAGRKKLVAYRKSTDPNYEAKLLHEIPGHLPIEPILQFLQARSDPEGNPLTELFGEPTKETNGWYRIPFLNPKGDMTQETFGGGTHSTAPETTRAWHGTCFEAVYSIIFHRGIAPSITGQPGEETLRGQNAVYFHKDSLRNKAEGYMRRVDLFGDGHIWGVLFEAVLDNQHRVTLGKTDQLGWKPQGVELRAMWVVGYSGGNVPLTARVGLAWHPELEGHPMRGPWAERLGTPTPIGLVSFERQDNDSEIINLTEEAPDWGGDEDQDMEDVPEEQVVDTSMPIGACGPASTEQEVGGAHSTAPLLQSNVKDARMIDDGWLHYDVYDLPIASGRMDRRVADALACKHTREMRRIADFNIPDNRPKSDLKINANDRHHADMSFKLVRLLRHDAWRHVLPMDSGGWVPLDALARFYDVDHEYLVCLVAACHMNVNCRMEVAMAPRHPNDLSLQAGLGDGTLENFHKGYGLLSWGNWRYLGIRCVQGHTLWGLHPERFGVSFTPAMAARAPCVRHATYLAAVPSICNVGYCRGAATRANGTRCISQLCRWATTRPSRGDKTRR